MALLRARTSRRPVKHAVEQLTGWYFTHSIQGYQFLQTGELPPSVVRERLKVAMARWRTQQRRILKEVRKSI